MFWTKTKGKHLVGIRLHLTGFFFHIQMCLVCTYTLCYKYRGSDLFMLILWSEFFFFLKKDFTKAASSFSKFDRMNKINLSCKHSSAEVYLFTQFSVQTNAHDKANIDWYCMNQTNSHWKFSQFHTGRGGFTWSWERNPSAFASMKHLFYT